MSKNKILKNKVQPLKITIADYLKAIKKADREIQLSQAVGFQSSNKIHQNKKVYNRKRDKKNFLPGE